MIAGRWYVQLADICHYDTAVCHYDTAICHYDTAVCHYDTAVCHYDTAIPLCIYITLLFY